MEINKIINLVKKSGEIRIYKKEGVQWITDLRAIYPLFGCPEFNETSLCAAYDISNEKTRVIFDELPRCFDFGDETEKEIECERGGPIFGALVPITTSHGLEFIKSKYLSPFSDVDDNMLRIYERTNAAGMTYFAVKEGFMLGAIIMPYDCIDEAFVKRLKDLAEQCEVSLNNKKKKAAEREGGK